MTGKQAYIWTVVGMGIILFFLLFPSAKDAVEGIDTTNFLAITTGGITLLPYVVVGIVLFVFLKALHIL